MAEISAKAVMDLRAKTGVGMMECKKALVEANGDFDEAVKVLREKGLSVAAKKAGRIASEGIVDIIKEGDTTVIIEVNAETDFVAKNASFKEFVKGILETILANKPKNVEELLALTFKGSDMTVEATLKDKIFTIGENMSIRRFEIVEGVTGTYVHGGGSAAVIAKFETSNGVEKTEGFAEFAKNICMQAAAMNPLYTATSDVPASVIEGEKQILLSQIENDDKLKGKPEAVKAKMVEGRISKYFDSNCLLEQQYVKEDDIKVSKYTENTAKELGGTIKIASFVKYERGEGLEKKEENFADEINKLVNG
ncbi:MAG: translation elongation factor Ts [Clostridiales bacterium GWF2_36_10]|nr:MAG: translation elongation factor Ts [Clostridiales bacterium GWF2_36_10]HAN21353.1 elongation factor Ts [Clostridiales bacterium]